MSSLVRRSFSSGLPGLRHEPTTKRVRAKLGERTVVDSTRAVLLWEPRRVVASWAVPEDDIGADLRPSAAAPASGGDDGVPLPDVSDRPVLDPSVPFAVHTAAGVVVDLADGRDVRTGAGLRLADPDLAGYVVLDFAAFDSWWEEEERSTGHPRDPFHRIDVLASSRHVRVELDGEVLADSTRPTLLFETMLPVRSYLPREDVRAELVPSSTRTTCAYKGHASYFSARVAGREVPDLAWSYEDPTAEASGVRDLVAFFDERLDVSVDGVRRDRPRTPWSRRARP
jgi:uncharacterized protein (DUF427 family)